MLAHLIIVVLGGGSVAFFTYFEIAVLRELRRTAKPWKLTSRLRTEACTTSTTEVIVFPAIAHSTATQQGEPLERKRMRLRLILVVAFVALFAAKDGMAQETIFNVPSGDILDKGKVYGEFDFAYLWDASSGAYTPRVVAGIGHRIEIGINLNGITSPGTPQTTPTPTFKWKAYEGKNNGWSFIVGDDLFIPAQNRSYNLGDYIYAEFTKTLKTQTRVTLGAFDFTSKIVASGNKAGGQFGIEQPVSKRFTLAADWFTGKHSAGYFAPGAVIRLTPKLTAYTAYEIGNSGLSAGNHLLLLEIGWNFN